MNKKAKAEPLVLILVIGVVLVAGMYLQKTHPVFTIETKAMCEDPSVKMVCLDSRHYVNCDTNSRGDCGSTSTCEQNKCISGTPTTETRTCSEKGGHICSTATNQYCRLGYINALDTNKCCAGYCNVAGNCLELGGKICPSLKCIGQTTESWDLMGTNTQNVCCMGICQTNSNDNILNQSNQTTTTTQNDFVSTLLDYLKNNLTIVAIVAILIVAFFILKK